MILLNDLKYDANDARTANIHVVILVIDRNYDRNDSLIANLVKSQELYRISGHSPELRYKTLINIVIPVNGLKYDVNDAGTANIHVVIPVIEQNYDINDIVAANLAKSREIYRISGHSPELRYKTLI